MFKISKVLGAACLALASFCAAAQTGAPPTHPATGGSDATSTPSPTTPPTHPAVGTSGATPEAARKQNPSMEGGKESGSASGGGGERNRRSTDPQAGDSTPKHPAAREKK